MTETDKTNVNMKEKSAYRKQNKRFNLSTHLTEVLAGVNRDMDEVISKEMSEHFLELIKTQIYRFRNQKVS